MLRQGRAGENVDNFVRFIDAAIVGVRRHNVDGCAPPASTTDGAITTSTAGCPDDRNVVLVTVDGGGHEWPSFATQRLWDFFAAHRA